MSVEVHPVAKIFPRMSDSEFSDLVADIAEHGLHEPIWLHSDGRIIDGRNRYQACAKAGVEPAFRTHDGDEAELVSFVLSLNLHRRHLTESQRAMVAAKVSNMARGGDRRRSDQSANLHFEGMDAPAPVSTAAAAEMLNVSERSVKTARKVVDRGVPELVAKVESGEIAVSAAAAIAEAPADEQREVVSLADRRERRDRERQIAERVKAERPPAPRSRKPGGMLPGGDINKRRQALNLLIGRAQAVYRELGEFSGEEISHFMGENPSIKQLLALLHDQHMSWFTPALADRPQIRVVEGGSS